MSIRGLLMVGLLGLSSLSGAAAESRAVSTELWKVRIVCVGAVGQTDEAARFHALLKEELARSGFVLVAQPEEADAVLTGVVSQGVPSDPSAARTTVTLQSRAGERLWGGEFPARSAMFKHAIRDTVRFRAENVARDLRRDWNTSAKGAGRPERK